jgi:hypothetical protein
MLRPEVSRRVSESLYLYDSTRPMTPQNRGLGQGRSFGTESTSLFSAARVRFDRAAPDASDVSRKCPVSQMSTLKWTAAGAEPESARETENIVSAMARVRPGKALGGPRRPTFADRLKVTPAWKGEATMKACSTTQFRRTPAMQPIGCKSTCIGMEVMQTFTQQETPHLSLSF